MLVDADRIPSHVYSGLVVLMALGFLHSPLKSDASQLGCTTHAVRLEQWLQNSSDCRRSLYGLDGL